MTKILKRENKTLENKNREKVFETNITLCTFLSIFLCASININFLGFLACFCLININSFYMPYRRTIGKQPYRYRQCGISQLEVYNEKILHSEIRELLNILLLAGWLLPLFIRNVMNYMLLVLLLKAIRLRYYIADVIDPVDHNNKDRLIESWSEKDCWDFFRIRKEDLKQLVILMHIPVVIVTKNRLTCPGEYALCLLLYRLHYPETLYGMCSRFGREYSQLCRIIDRTLDIVFEMHHNKIRGNIHWYVNFTYYNPLYMPN